MTKVSAFFPASPHTAKPKRIDAPSSDASVQQRKETSKGQLWENAAQVIRVVSKTTAVPLSERIRFPASRSVLWDRTPQGAPQLLRPATPRLAFAPQLLQPLAVATQLPQDL